MPVDISEVLALDARAGQLLERRPNDELIAATEKAVETERRTHPYHNITRRLQTSTVAKVVAGPDPAINDVVMGMDYASHVRAKGRTKIDDHVETAKRRFQRFADSVADELSKK
jgi:hypothetical protein